MINDRDMYYSGYGYGGMIPLGNNPNTQIPPMQMPNPTIPNNYTTSQFNDINERVSRLERQVKRLDQRLTRIETPYANNNLSNNEPDNNMYMM